MTRSSTAAIALSAVFGVFTSGCGTIQSIKLDRRTEPSQDIQVVYGGVHFDNRLLNADKSWGAASQVENCCAFPFALLDLPLSFVADTVVLPYTIPRAYDRRQEIAKKVVTQNWQIYQGNRSQLTNQPPHQLK